MKFKVSPSVLTLSVMSCVSFADDAVGQQPGTNLNAGDIAIVGFNSDGPDEFAFLLLADVEAGTNISFTDKGWQSSGSLRANEGIETWTAGSDLSAGTLINFPAASFSTTDSGFVLSTSGDQILAYQGSDSSPSFLYAIHFNGAQEFDTSLEIDSNETTLPTGLTIGSSAVAIGETDNAVFDFSSFGTDQTPDQWRSLISDPDNWNTTNSDSGFTMPTNSNTTVNVVPSPTAGFGALCLMGLTAARRRRRGGKALLSSK
ncbi:MAG: hypothetical protein AAGI37_16660 [Planctomycetota bacterium]